MTGIGTAGRTSEVHSDRTQRCGHHHHIRPGRPPGAGKTCRRTPQRAGARPHHGASGPLLLGVSARQVAPAIAETQPTNVVL
jgi:hypothetical protein